MLDKFLFLPDQKDKSITTRIFFISIPYM